MRSGKSWLCAELMRTKSGYSDWAVNPKTIWPQWSWERLGALAMTSDPKGDKKRSLDELIRLADKRLAAWWRGNRVPFNPQGTSHFLYAWNVLMGFPEKTDPDVFKTIRHLDIEGLQDYRMSLINGSRRTLAGN